MNVKKSVDRREFLSKTALASAAVLFGSTSGRSQKLFSSASKHIPIFAHLWVYASKFPPNWDCTPNLETVFSDLSYAGIEGLELMEANLRHDDAVIRIGELIKKYNLAVSGSSYGVGLSLFDKDQHQKILSDIKIIIPRLSKLGGKTFGISVGHSKAPKTEDQFDAQADILIKIRSICSDQGIIANLHNHTYEVENDLYDLKGTLARIPDFKLGPDINWLIRAGINPVEFINTYGKQIVYLHLRDQYADGIWTEYLGQGDTDFKNIAKALKGVGFEGQAAIELAFPQDYSPKKPLKEDWRISREFVQNTFGW
ncbi:sugar phosphate isomerase/epimerase family protein [Eudoraea chungangensis]|uniref:sugar phosphate isomerase/epimerase family protein n=1 Tax=Eudoraea chungangensis TaxID=1481905 RepID=UPI0023EC354F|nr:sugar phosphate isomerase/epimerase [Eudoraea chungangensis]